MDSKKMWAYFNDNKANYYADALSKEKEKTQQDRKKN